MARWTVRALLVAALGTLTASAPESLDALINSRATTTRGAGLAGYDISWPECSLRRGGRGLPMPSHRARWVIVGLTSGRPMTTNPCLDEQLTWAWLHRVPVQAYTMAGRPTPAQLAATGTHGPWPATTPLNRLRNAGWAQARQTVRTTQDAGFLPPRIWVDVEPLRRQPWPTDTAADQAGNRAVLEGLLRGLAEAGFPSGLYASRSPWSEITGGWKLPEVPVWVTAGPSDRSAAVRACDRPGFSGGPVWVAQWYTDIQDFDVSCAPFRLALLPGDVKDGRAAPAR